LLRHRSSFRRNIRARSGHGEFSATCNAAFKSPADHTSSGKVYRPWFC
jgi:hypothetical protein